MELVELLNAPLAWSASCSENRKGFITLFGSNQ